MGQQQLLLIILGTIIVGIAISVGVVLFKDSMVDNDRDAIQNDLATVAVRAQEYYYRPATMGGGGHSFVGLTDDDAGMAKIVGRQFSDNENARYTITTAGTASLVIVTAVGKVALADGTYPTYTCRIRDRKLLTIKIN